MNEEMNNNQNVTSAEEFTEVIGVSFREAGKIYYFHPGKISFTQGSRVIVDTARGVEIGTVKLPNKKIPSSEITTPLKPVTRLATAQDIEHDAKNRQAEMDAAIVCKKKIQAHGLEMSLVAVEYTFDNSKLIFYFTCESRVDFRELVKVSIKMAKEQNFSLNSSKVSGACGRLMCCLRYEHEIYEEALKVTPPVGSIVKTSDGVGTVTETRPLAAEIKVKLNDNDKDAPKLYKCADVKIIKVNGKKDKSEELSEDIPND